MWVYLRQIMSDSRLGKYVRDLRSGRSVEEEGDMACRLGKDPDGGEMCREERREWCIWLSETVTILTLIDRFSIFANSITEFTLFTFMNIPREILEILREEGRT